MKTPKKQTVVDQYLTHSELPQDLQESLYALHYKQKDVVREYGRLMHSIAFNKGYKSGRGYWYPGRDTPATIKAEKKRINALIKETIPLENRRAVCLFGLAQHKDGESDGFWDGHCARYGGYCEFNE